jgi:hypothetical protein
MTRNACSLHSISCRFIQELSVHMLYRCGYEDRINRRKGKNGELLERRGEKTKTDEECRKQKKMMNKRRKNLKCIILSSQKIKSLRSSRAFNPPETKRKNSSLTIETNFFLWNVSSSSSIPPTSFKKRGKQKIRKLVEKFVKTKFFRCCSPRIRFNI